MYSYFPIISNINDPETPGSNPNVIVIIPDINIEIGDVDSRSLGESNSKEIPNKNPKPIGIIFCFLKYFFPEIIDDDNMNPMKNVNNASL